MVEHLHVVDNFPSATPLHQWSPQMRPSSWWLEKIHWTKRDNSALVNKILCFSQNSTSKIFNGISTGLSKLVQCSWMFNFLTVSYHYNFL